MLFKPFKLINKSAKEKRFRFEKNKAKQLKTWQANALVFGKGERFLAIQAWCGSGKTVLQIALAIQDILTSGHTQKQLITVPQSHIGEGFSKESIKLGKREYDWVVSKNYTEPSLQKIAQLREWLLTSPEKLKARRGKSTVINGLVAICSHKALVMAWNSMSPTECVRAVRNLTIRVDEAHHVKQAGTDEAFVDHEMTKAEQAVAQEEGNGLGKIIDYVTASKVPSVKLCFTTATFFRGDCAPIILQKAKDKFKFFHLDFLEHWVTLGIETLTFQYEEYSQDPCGEILSSVRNNPGRKFLVIVPPRTLKWRDASEGEERVEKLARGLKRLGNVCDLVVRDSFTESQQQANKKLLLAEKRAKKPQFDIVFSCNLVREGTDWVPCDYVLNAAVESSPTVAVQTLGRPFRYCESKTEVTIRTFVKKFVLPDDSDIGPRELLSDRTNGLLVLTMLHDMSYPVKLAPLPKSEWDDDGGEEPDTLEALYGQAYYDKIIPTLYEDFEELLDKTEAGIDCVIDMIMDRYSTPERYRDTVKKALKVRVIRHFKSPTLLAPIDATYLRRLGFDKIVQGRSLYYGDLSKKDMARVYDLIRKGYSEFYNSDYEGFIKD